jgi:hypothetical protein
VKASEDTTSSTGVAIIEDALPLVVAARVEQTEACCTSEYAAELQAKF